jgi:hypothetical protein
VEGQSYLRLPTGWEKLGHRGLGPFVTAELLRRPDGTTVLWESRRHRKRPVRPSGSTWWAPATLGWWIGVLFSIGSVCFAAGALPAFTDAVGARDDGVTFFVGSWFFTTAALLSYCQVAWVDSSRPGPRRAVAQLFRVQLRRIDWLAATIQLAGTVFFNVSTGHAIAAAAVPSSVNQLVWRPDAYGSVCFLVASWLSWAEVCHGAWRWNPRQLSWRIAFANLVGSIAFGVSAIASKVEPDGDLRSLALTNLGTFVGALCFLGGALWLLPERTEGDDATGHTGPAGTLRSVEPPPAESG